MNKFTVLTAALMVAVVSASAQVARRGDFQISQVSSSFVRTPDIQFQGDTRRTPPAQKWLELEVGFESRAEFTDELTVKYYVLLAGGKLLNGEVTHINVPKGRELFSVMYVPPRFLERLLEGKALTTSAVENVGIQILAKGQLVAEKSQKELGMKWWESPRLQGVSGMLLNKSETPFAPLFWDRYEMIKPAR